MVNLMDKTPIGKVMHYYDKIGVAIVELSAPLNKGDKISIEREGAEPFEQTVESMQVEHKSVLKAKKGDAIGLKVVQPAKEGAKVFKI